MTPLTILLISISIIAIAKGMSWLIAREKPRPELAEYGDVVFVPTEFRLPGKKAGGRPRKAGEPVTEQSHNHVPDIARLEPPL